MIGLVICFDIDYGCSLTALVSLKLSRNTLTGEENVNRNIWLFSSGMGPASTRGNANLAENKKQSPGF